MMEIFYFIHKYKKKIIIKKRYFYLWVYFNFIKFINFIQKTNLNLKNYVKIIIKNFKL